MASTIRSLRQGEYLFQEGDIPRAMYLLQKGTISVRKAKGTGEIELAQLKQGDVLGELSFFDRKPRSASAVALVQTELLEIDFESLDKIYSQVPEYLQSIIANVVHRLRKANDTIKKLQKEQATDPSKRQSSQEDPDGFSALAAIRALGKIDPK
jgi:CRP/FNR family cyclic AMP-dependent transcriptional regulator